MKKISYSVFTFALMALVTPTSANAQNPFRAKSQHKMAAGSPPTVPKQADARFGTDNQKATPRFVTANLLHRVSAQELEAKSNEKVVVTSFTHTVGSTQSAEGKVKYDQQGRVINISTDDNFSVNTSYVDNANGKWTTKTVSTINLSTQQETERTKTERTFDAQGRILSIDTFTYDFKREKWQPTHSYTYDYDYEHMRKAQYFSRNDGAIITKDISYKALDDGSIQPNGYEYIWYEARQCFLQNTYNASYQWENHLDGNTLLTSEKYIDKTTGEVMSAIYSKEEVLRETPQAGYYTMINSESDDNKNWTIVYKLELTNNYYDPYTQNDGKDREFINYQYNSDSQQYEFYSKNFIKWVNHPTLKLVKKAELGGYKMIDELKYTIFPIDENGNIDEVSGKTYHLFQNGEYVIGDETYTDKDEGCYRCIFYTAQGEETRQVRLHYSQMEPTPFCLEELKNGVWTPVKNETIHIGDQENRISITTNENGYPLWYESYDNNQLETTYDTEYNNTGFILNSYNLSTTSQEKYLYVHEVCTTLADGSTQVIDTYYDEDGNVEKLEKYVYQEDRTIFYEWDNVADDWSAYPDVDLLPITTKDADGTVTTIDRTYVDGEVVNKSMTISKPTIFPSIAMEIPSNPLPELIPDEIFTNIHPYEDGLVMGYSFYDWDSETSQWKFDKKTENNYTAEKDESKGITIHHVTRNFLEQNTYAYGIDSKNRLVTYQDNTNSYVFEYDGEGRLAKVVDQADENEDKVETYILSYGKTNVTDGISLPTASLALHLHVNGRTISAEGCKSIQLYSLDGKLVGKSQAGNVTAPANGIYIVVADGVKTKMNIR